MKRLLVVLMMVALVLSSAFAGGAAEKSRGSDTVKIGLVTAVTGPNSLVGEESTEGAQLAINQINARGGVNGQMLELVITDEVNNAEASVLATQELLANPDIVGIVGSMYSAYCIAAMPSVAEAGVPFISLGSSSGVSKEKNPWTWQDRPLDTAQGEVVANFVVDTLGCRNPAIMHSTQSTFQSLYEQIFAALKRKGLNITEARNEFGFPEDTANYAPYIAQVIAGDYDCLIALGNQNPAGVICQQVAQAGLTSARMPLVGSTSWCSNVCITAAGDAANGWYSISDWCPGGSNETAARFEKDYCEYSGRSMSDLAAACAYDAVYILAEAMKKAGTNTDKARINEAMKSVEFEGAVSYFKYHEDHSFASTLTVTQNIDGRVVPQFAIKYR